MTSLQGAGAANAKSMPEPEPEVMIPVDPSANPFKLLVDPALRARLRQALLELVDNHDQELAKYVAEGFLELDSYKEYIELYARHLRETMSSKEGVAYLLHACGFEVPMEEINTQAEARWKVQR